MSVRVKQIRSEMCEITTEQDKLKENLSLAFPVQLNKLGGISQGDNIQEFLCLSHMNKFNINMETRHIQIQI